MGWDVMGWDGINWDLYQRKQWLTLLTILKTAVAPTAAAGGLGSS